MMDSWLRIEKRKLCNHLFASAVSLGNVCSTRNKQSRKDLAPAYFPSGTIPCKDLYNETSEKVSHDLYLIVHYPPMVAWKRWGQPHFLRKTDAPSFASYPTHI